MTSEVLPAGEPRRWASGLGRGGGVEVNCQAGLAAENNALPIGEMAWLFLVVATPLVFNPWGIQVFDLPKVALVRSLVFGLTGALLLRRLIFGQPCFAGRLRISWFDPRLWAGATGLTLALSTVTSLDHELSFWGTYDRQEGLYTALAYLTLFLLVASGLRGREQAQRLALAVALGGFPVVAYGFLQWLGLDPIPWRMSDKSPVLATLGRSNFLGSYLVMAIPLCTGALLLSRRRTMRILLGVILAGSLAVLVFTTARSAWVAIAVAALVMVFPSLLRRVAWRRLLRYAGIAVAAIAVFVAVYLGTLGASGELKPDRLLPAFQFKGSFAARLTIWQASAKLIAERPVLGYGPDGFASAFPHVFPPQLVFYQGREAVTDRAHNVFLQQAMTSGIVGLIAYLGLMAVVVSTLVRGLRRSQGSSRILMAAILAAVVGHLTDILFSFDVASTAVVFWAVMGAGVGLSRGMTGDGSTGRGLSRKTIEGRRTRGRFLASGLAVMGISAILVSNTVPVVTDTFAGLSFVPGLPLEERIERARRAVELWPFEPTYRAILGGLYAERAGNELDPRPSLEHAEAEYVRVVVARPREPRAWAALGDIRGRRGLALGEPGSLAGAEAAYQRAVDLAPTMATLHAAQGVFELAAGRFELATAKLERAVSLDPTDVRAWTSLADAYRALGREKEAGAALSTALRMEQQIREERR
ncbi:MAG: O-antigen ligase family protein [Chloroflexi bacterium]|nr:O-antigen ligase family protein [Chloroflexota bacterium]